MEAIAGLGGWIGLVAIAFAIGAYAGAIGAGGGFLLAPALLLRHPDADPAAITTATLTVVLAASAKAALAGLRGGPSTGRSPRC